MPSDYTSSISISDGGAVIISGYCRDGKRRISLRVDSKVVFMSSVEVIMLIRDLAIALSKPCHEYGQKNQPRQVKEGRQQGSQSQQSKKDDGKGVNLLESGKVAKI